MSLELLRKQLDAARTQLCSIKTADKESERRLTEVNRVLHFANTAIKELQGTKE